MKYIKYINIIFIGLFFCQYYQNYGKNIVQYDDFNWNYIQTEHFDIYTYSPGDDHADLVAKESEEAYQKLSKVLQWRLKNRVSIIIYNSHNDFQQTNVIKQYMREGIGGVTELYKNRVVIPFDGSLIEFRDVLHHELLHAFINDCVYGGSLRRKITSSIQFSIPHWMNEGLAEYTSVNWNTNSDMWMRDLTINRDQLLNIDQLRGYLGYRGGQSVWRFITSKWGDESIAEIFWQIKQNRNVNEGIKKSIGINIKTLNEQWKNYLKETYWDEIGVRQNINEFARQLTNHEDWQNTYNVAPSISPNGGKIAILSNKEGPMGIYIISADNGKVIKHIVQGERNSEYEELHILKPGITWSPDGTYIAFSAKSGEFDALYIINSNTYEKEKIRFENNIEGIFRPSWSPSGNKIAFIGNNGISSDIYLFNRSSGELSNLTNDWYSEDHVSWSPDGNKLLFVSDRGENLNINSQDRSNYFSEQLDIYSLSLESGEMVRLTDTEYNETYPVISSDNETIAYISDESGVNNIYLTSNNFKNSHPITNIMTGITQLSWNGDDTQLIFTGFYKSGYDVFILANPKDLVGSIDSIKFSKWRLEDKDFDFSRKDSTMIADKINEDKYKNYILTDLNEEQESLEKETISYSKKDSSDNYIIHNYKPRFTLDYANYGIGYNYMVGNQVMANFIFSDILGDYNFFISIDQNIASFNSADFHFVFNNLKNKIDKIYYLYQDVRHGWAYPYDSDGDLIYDVQAWGKIREVGFLNIYSYPLSKFRRFEYGLNINYKEETTNYNLGGGGWSGSDDVVIINRAQTSLEPNIRYVSDHTYWMNNAVSGYRSSIEYVYSYKVLPYDNKNDDSISQLGFNRFMIDHRYYKPLFNGINFVFRIFGGTSWSRDDLPDQNKFYLGGAPCLPAWDCPQGININNMFDEESVMPLRGIDVYSKLGENVLLYNFELRLPFLIYYFPAIQFLGQINGAVFCDIGGTWDSPETYKKFFDEDSWWEGDSILDAETGAMIPNIDSVGWAMSYGFGPRFIFLGLPWQIDFTWEYNPYTGTLDSRKTFLRIFPEF